MPVLRFDRDRARTPEGAVALPVDALLSRLRAAVRKVRVKLTVRELTRAASILLLRTGVLVNMSADQPTRDDLRYGMTVEIVQEDKDNDNPLLGDIENIITEERTHPGGILVELQSGVQGRVRRIVTDE